MFAKTVNGFNCARIFIFSCCVSLGQKKLIICFSGTFLGNDAGGWLFIFNFF